MGKNREKDGSLQRNPANLEAVLELKPKIGERFVVTWKVGREPDFRGIVFGPEVSGSLERSGDSLVARASLNGQELVTRMPLVYDKSVKHFRVSVAKVKVDLARDVGWMEPSFESYKAALSIQQNRGKKRKLGR